MWRVLIDSYIQSSLRRFFFANISQSLNHSVPITYYATSLRQENGALHLSYMLAVLAVLKGQATLRIGYLGSLDGIKFEA